MFIEAHIVFHLAIIFITFALPSLIIITIRLMITIMMMIIRIYLQLANKDRLLIELQF